MKTEYRLTIEGKRPGGRSMSYPKRDYEHARKDRDQHRAGYWGQQGIRAKIEARTVTPWEEVVR